MLKHSIFLLAFFATSVHAQVDPARIDASLSEVDAAAVGWRRDIHQHPELSNREERTAALVAKHLKSLGLEVRTGIARHGVVALLRGGRAGKTIALRADMDALPVTEATDVAFKSTARSTYLNKEVGVMHACGHDAHTAGLMAIAQALTSMRKDLPGNVLFIFQPAEEGAPEGEDGGAALMLREGVFDLAKPEAVFGLHVVSALNSGVLGYRSGPFMAAADAFHMQVKGRQTHGSRPWSGIDPVVTAAQIIVGAQTIVSRQTDITRLPAVVTFGKVDGGVRSNIIPDNVDMYGTIRTFDPKMREDIIHRLRHTAEHIAAANGASATLTMNDEPTPLVYNNPQLTAHALPALRRAAGVKHVVELPLQTGAEDFAEFAQVVPGFFFFVGVTPPAVNAAQAPANHSPLFYVDEAGMKVGMRALMQVALDYLYSGTEGESS